jgi:oxygen-independent coproporphyrinogen-3 oxidase
MNYIRYAEEFYEANNIDDINKKGFSRTLASFHLVDMYPSIKAMEKFSNEKKWTSLIKKSPDAAESAAIYLHFPFCNSFCSYCHLYKEIADGSAKAEIRYVAALKKEIETYARLLGKKLTVRSLYFGGGTPSLMSASALKEILSILKLPGLV